MNFENYIEEDRNYNDVSMFKKIYSIFDIAFFKMNEVFYYGIEKNKSDEHIMLDLV